MRERNPSAATAEAPPPTTAPRPRLRTELRNAENLLVCLDFDGTLAPIVDDPSEAEPTVANQRALETLARSPVASTAIVSGRSLTDVRERVTGPGVYAGNHGLELARDGSVAIHPIARKRGETIDRVCAILEEVLEPVPNCRIENKRLTGTIHVRSVPAPARELVFDRVSAVVDRFGDDSLELSTGKAVIEVSPAVPWGKGAAVELIEAACPPETFTLYLGDDVTDESAFQAVQPEGLGIHVGDRESSASARLASPDAVASFLRWLAETGIELISGGHRHRRAVIASR